MSTFFLPVVVAAIVTFGAMAVGWGLSAAIDRLSSRNDTTTVSGGSSVTQGDALESEFTLVCKEIACLRDRMRALEVKVNPLPADLPPTPTSTDSRVRIEWVAGLDVEDRTTGELWMTTHEPGRVVGLSQSRGHIAFCSMGYDYATKTLDPEVWKVATARPSSSLKAWEPAEWRGE